MDNSTQIVMLGGGYTTVWAYRSLVSELSHAIRRGEVRIVVVCPEDHHFFHGWTAESLTGIVQNENRMSPLAPMLSRAQLVKGKAEAVDQEERLVSVRTADGSVRSIHYDHLVIGMGSYDSREIAGVERYGYQVKAHAAFIETQEEIRSIVRRAALGTKVEALKLLTFTVCGGGYTGVELAANLAEFVNVLMKPHASLRGMVPTIRLVYSKDTVLDALGSRLSRMRRYTERVMSEYGIELIPNRRVKEITWDGAWLDDNTFLPSSMVISAVGQARVWLKGMENLQRDTLGRLHTDSHLRLLGMSNVWGGGDACSVPFRQTATPCVPNALWAMNQGAHLGKNVARAIRRKPLRHFAYRGLGQCASLGIGKGVGEMYGIVFTGWLAWIMRWVVFNYFMPSRKVMIREIGDWLHLLFTGRRRGLGTMAGAEQSAKLSGAFSYPKAAA
jgi:NADH dehydrogenase